MASDTLSLKSRRLGDDIRLEIRIRHPMETGHRSDAQGQLIPAKYIQSLIVSDVTNGGDEVLFHAHCGTGISRNPYFALELLGVEKGAVLSVQWLDNFDDSDRRRIRVS